ncbi:methionine--tRNA ligase [Candidatus Mycoplasma mahonii]|uniref:methionine--tRNA ligase n=1 Tax=Candidatus Mycoplasma mahonii TaxID=3004105 RepID=UPI0026F326F9|nr:methionine--tRNA ligase [Candidatus Mycoplasma mahonii]WKX02560.1 methionine--tRNA ligase [Candidatus Mycoplasma mahonii]
MSKKTFYITTPIYYPSGDLHIGHVYTTTLARTFANYKIMNGYDVKFLTGADEHGQKIEKKAQEFNVNPQAYVDKMALSFKNLWDKLGIEYDFFSRTTDKDHMIAISKIFSQLLNDGLMYKGTYKGLYSISDEEFLTETQAKLDKGKYYHPLSGHDLVEVEEESYFFRISAYENWLKKYIHENKDFIMPHKIIKELLSNFLDKGIDDLSISRTSFSWGVPVSEDKTHVIYVWIDALSNYITALGYNSENDDDFNKYWVNGDEIVHLVGKEITRFHCIYWPIILKSLGLRQPTKILSHGWIITPDGKMSKSKGNVVDPIKLIDKFGSEQVKYFFSAKLKLGNDGIFDEEILKNAINSDLSNNYGNLLSRTIAMMHQNFDAPVKYRDSLTKVDEKIFSLISETLIIFKDKFNEFNPTDAFDSVMNLSRELNGYIDITKPWTLKENKSRLEIILNTLLNGIYAVTALLSIVIPNKAKEASDMLGITELSFENITDFTKFDKVIVKTGGPLFERIK